MLHKNAESSEAESSCVKSRIKGVAVRFEVGKYEWCSFAQQTKSGEVRGCSFGRRKE
jgi:hypothetical protein